MTNAELIAKIKAEIERRVDILATVSVKQAKDGDSEMSTYYHGKAVSLEELISFLSTLESEKPVPKDLEEAAREFAKDAYPDKHNLVWMFKRGAKWQKEQMMKEAVPFYEILKVVPPGPERDKVRIIIVKE